MDISSSWELTSCSGERRPLLTHGEEQQQGEAGAILSQSDRFPPALRYRSMQSLAARASLSSVLMPLFLLHLSYHALLPFLKYGFAVAPCTPIRSSAWWHSVSVLATGEPAVIGSPGHPADATPANKTSPVIPNIEAYKYQICDMEKDKAAGNSLNSIPCLSLQTPPWLTAQWRSKAPLYCSWKYGRSFCSEPLIEAPDSPNKVEDNFLWPDKGKNCKCGLSFVESRARVNPFEEGEVAGVLWNGGWMGGKVV